MKILTDENGGTWEVLGVPQVIGLNDLRADVSTVRLRPLPPPAKSLEEEVREESLFISGPFSERKIIALIQVLERRLAKLEGKK